MQGGTTSQEISLTISPINDEAIITGDISAEGDKDETIKGHLTSIDVDGLTDSTYYTILTENTPKYGTASIDAETGEWQYKASTNFQLQDSFSVTIEDDLGGKTYQDISVQLRPSLRAISEDSGGAIETIGELFSDYMAVDNNRYLAGVTITGNEADPVTEGKWQFLLTEDVTIELPEHRAKGIAQHTNDQTTRSYVFKGISDPDGKRRHVIGFNPRAWNTVYGSLDRVAPPGSTVEILREPNDGTVRVDTRTGEWKYTPNQYTGLINDSFSVSVYKPPTTRLTYQALQEAQLGLLKPPGRPGYVEHIPPDSLGQTVWDGIDSKLFPAATAVEDLADRIEMAIKYSKDEGSLDLDDDYSHRTFSATGSFAYHKPQTVNGRPGLPEIPQPGTQEYREYFEKYGHIINQLWDDDSYSDTEYIPIRFTSDLGKLDYIKLYDIYDGPISYIDDPSDYFYSSQGRGLVYYSIDKPELFNEDSENFIDDKYIIADLGQRIHIRKQLARGLIFQAQSIKM